MKYWLRPIDRWPRELTPREQRRRAPFKAHYDETLRKLAGELAKLGAAEFILMRALRDWDIRQDGELRARARDAEHPGIIIAAMTKYGPLKWACDEFDDWHDNVRGIALTLERLRMAELYGVSKAGEQYTGWRALPGPIVTPPPMTVEEAAVMVGNAGGGVPFREVIRSRDTYRAAYRRAASKLHPDALGGERRPEWDQLQQASAVLEKHHDANGQEVSR